MTHAETEALRKPIEEGHEPALLASLLVHGRTAAAAIEQAFPVDAALGDNVLRAQLVEHIEAIYADAFAALGPAVYADVVAMKRTPPDADHWLERAAAFVAEHGGRLVSLIQETTRSIVQEVVTFGLAQGWGTERIARELRTRWPEIARVRARRIARTETVRASNAASLDAARKAAEVIGKPLEKVWLATPDGRTRDSHAAMNGQAVPFDAEFVVGGYPAAYPNDPALPASESVNCRCTVTYRVAEKAVGIGGFHPKDAARVEQAWWIGHRNATIRRAYHELKGKGVSQTDAIAALSERPDVALSYSGVERAIWPR